MHDLTLFIWFNTTSAIHSRLVCARAEDQQCRRILCLHDVLTDTVLRVRTGQLVARFACAPSRLLLPATLSWPLLVGLLKRHDPQLQCTKFEAAGSLAPHLPRLLADRKRTVWRVDVRVGFVYVRSVLFPQCPRVAVDAASVKGDTASGRARCAARATRRARPLLRTYRCTLRMSALPASAHSCRRSAQLWPECGTPAQAVFVDCAKSPPPSHSALYAAKTQIIQFNPVT